MLAGLPGIARVQRIPDVALHHAGARVDDFLPFATKRHGKRDGRAAGGRRSQRRDRSDRGLVDTPQHALECFGSGPIDLLGAGTVRPASAHAIA
jgi:hypothetical protein